MGGTGSGKSSLVSLICRLYDVDRDAVSVGGQDVRSYDLESLRQQVAVVPQKNVLFSGTILDNLRWGKEDATEEECAEACRQACADEFIQRLPDGYHTWIEQGAPTSPAGRSSGCASPGPCSSTPKILILVDSTSAVDTATDAKIRQAFAQKIPRHHQAHRGPADHQRPGRRPHPGAGRQRPSAGLTPTRPSWPQTLSTRRSTQPRPAAATSTLWTPTEKGRNPL